MSKKNLKKLFSDQRYKGKHIVMIDNKVFTATTGQRAAEIFEKATKKYPKKIPLIAYIPKQDSLIL